MRIGWLILTYILLIFSSIAIPTASLAATGEFIELSKANELNAKELIQLLNPRMENNVVLDNASLEDNALAAVYLEQSTVILNTIDSIDLMNPIPVYRSEGDIRHMIRYFEWALAIPFYRGHTRSTIKNCTAVNNSLAAINSRKTC